MNLSNNQGLMTKKKRHYLFSLICMNFCLQIPEAVCCFNQCGILV
uniref:Uncharacterized protein n=1 Tax=Rhizophora mucronata TaxID=61149 RepID=A0A2P2R3K7_RHIMU